MTRTMNFNPGPSCLPLPVLEQAQAEFLDFAGTGMSVLEVSHRSPEYDAVHEGVQAKIKKLLGLGDDYKVMFMGGGASSQFAYIPLNFLSQNKVGNYVDTGTWSTKAITEANIIGPAHFGDAAHVAASSKEQGFTRIPTQDEWRLSDNAAYVHITTNNTIKGTQYHWTPQVDVPVIADMSSDILWRPIEADKYAMFYAGAQKNLGPAGVCVVVMRKDFLEQANEDLPTMFMYKTHAKKNSLYNTPPCFPIYMVGKVVDWIEDKGGLVAVEAENREKGDLLYSTIAKFPDFYTSPVEEASRSYMNVVFRLPTEELEQKFVAQGKERNMNGLKGHRSVGGIRVSMYNAVGLEWIQAVTQYMEEFVKDKG